MVTLTEQIRKLREAAGMTQAQLADRIFVVRSAVTLMEQPGRFPDVARLPMIADALNCTIDELFGREVPRQS